MRHLLYMNNQMGSNWFPSLTNCWQPLHGTSGGGCPTDSLYTVPKLWLRYMDNTFVVWLHGQEEQNHFMSIKFIVEFEKDNKLALLNVHVTRSGIMQVQHMCLSQTVPHQPPYSLSLPSPSKNEHWSTKVYARQGQPCRFSTRSKETKHMNTSRMSSKPMISLRILWERCSSRNPTLLLNHLSLIQSHQRSSVYHMSHVAAYKLLLSHTLQFCNWKISVVKTSHHCSLVLHVNVQYQSSSWNSLSIITVITKFC